MNQSQKEFIRSGQHLPSEQLPFHPFPNALQSPHNSTQNQNELKIEVDNFPLRKEERQIKFGTFSNGSQEEPMKNPFALMGENNELEKRDQSQEGEEKPFHKKSSFGMREEPNHFSGGFQYEFKPEETEEDALNSILSLQYNSSYLKKYHSRIKKSPSLYIPELHEDLSMSLALKRNNSMSKYKQLFYKAQRIQFQNKHLEVSQPLISSSQANSKFIFLLLPQTHLLICQELHLNSSAEVKQRTQLASIENNGEKDERTEGDAMVKHKTIRFAGDDDISPNVEYDHHHLRIYCFSNKWQKIYVYSSSKMELLCKVTVQKKVFNPFLHFYSINSRHFLILLGGTSNSIDRDIVHGNKFIEIFQLKKWEIILKSRILKLIIGRIAPIFIAYKKKEKTSLLILGGNSIAKVKKFLNKNRLDFEVERDINLSTNLTGAELDPQQILEAFNNEEVILYNTLSVRVKNPILLHSCFVMTMKSSLMILQPGSQQLFQVRLIHSEVNITPWKNRFYLDLNQEQYYRNHINFILNDREISIYRLTEKGKLQTIKIWTESEEAHSKQWHCQIY